MSALPLGRHTPVDATAGPVTVTLPTGATSGTELVVEKLDSSSNAVTISGSIRGVGGSTIILTAPHETMIFRASGSGSWWPQANHISKSYLDNTYMKYLRPSGDTTGVVDTAAITAAINSGAAAGGGTVILGNSAPWYVTGIKLKSDVTVSGPGSLAIVNLVSNSNTHLISLFDVSQIRVNIEHLRLECNGANQTGTVHGIYLDNTGGNVFATGGGRRHRISSCVVNAAAADGVNLGDAGTTYVYDVVSTGSGRNNFRAGSADTRYDQCISGVSKASGVYVAAPNQVFVGVKSWNAGMAAKPAYLVDGTTPLAGVGDGFYIADSISRVRFIGCEAQDNYGSGFCFDNASNCTVSGTTLDSNGDAALSLINGSRYIIGDATVLNRSKQAFEETTAHKYVLRIGDSNVRYNGLRLSSGGATIANIDSPAGIPATNHIVSNYFPDPFQVLPPAQINGVGPARDVLSIRAGAGLTARIASFYDSAGTERSYVASNGDFVTKSFRNLLIGEGSVANGAGVIGLRNAGTLPSNTPTAGGVLYSDAGALKWKGSSGTVTIIAPA